MEREEIKKDLIGIFSEQAEIPYEEISEDDEMIKDLNISSLELMTIFAEIEEKFEVEIEDDEIMECISLREIIDYIEKKKNE